MDFKICITIELIVKIGYNKCFKMQEYKGEYYYKKPDLACL